MSAPSDDKVKPPLAHTYSPEYSDILGRWYHRRYCSTLDEEQQLYVNISFEGREDTD